MMKSLKSALVASLFVVASCSNDNSGADPVSIVGTWDAVELQLDESTATEDELLASDFLEILTANDCYVLSVVFTESGTATTENALNYLDLSGLATGNFDIPCPQQADSESASYTYEDGQLTITDAQGQTTVVAARISGAFLTMDLDGSVFDDVVSQGQLIFRKR